MNRVIRRESQPTKKTQNKVTDTSFIYPRTRFRNAAEPDPTRRDPRRLYTGDDETTAHVLHRPRRSHGHASPHLSPSFLSVFSPFSHVCATAMKWNRPLFSSCSSLSLSFFSPLDRREGRPETQRHGKRRRREGHAWWRVERGREWLVLLFRACG